MELDISKMLEGIRNLKRAKRPAMTNGMKYLNDLFVSAAVKGKTPCFGEVDYERFTMEELNEYNTLYSDEILKCHNAAERFVKSVYGAKPVGTSARSFF